MRYVVEHALVGDTDSLKERSIGVQLFGRAPTYDTGADAVVRVTASDVRKRLQQHYKNAIRSGTHLKISLPPGSYVPEITQSEVNPAEQGPEGLKLGKPDNVVEDNSVSGPPRSLIYRWFIGIAVAAALGLAAFAVVRRSATSAISPQTRVLPWSVFFRQSRPVIMVTSDPNIASIVSLTRTPISLSDYANQHYIPDGINLSPEILFVCRYILRGNPASIDTPIVAGVAELAGKNSAQVNVRDARGLQFSDLDTDDNFIFLGSPRTDPWITLFDGQLDFRFYFDPKLGQEIIQNARPQQGESDLYIPTAKGFATGQSFATISFIRNQNHAGNVLILAGANAEGTKAAGELAVNLQTLASSLRQCGGASFEGVQHFQLLLRVNVMAGSPGNFSVIACHALP